MESELIQCNSHVIPITQREPKPWWIFQLVLDLDLVQHERKKLPLLPEARALILFSSERCALGAANDA